MSTNTGSSPTLNGVSALSMNSAISSSDYARKCKQLMELDKDLRTLGAGMFIDLPRITVTGGQSAGKSSLVEAVSGINVPRDSGTCTRCPMECTMSSAADSWSCTISLRTQYDRDGNQLEASKEHQFGPVIADKSAVEIWLRRAQAATLNPHVSNDEFLSKSADELRQMGNSDPQMLSFSKNVVHVEVKDPELTDLSFIDLPGLIQNSDPDVIDLVRDLVVSNIQGENTLILVTIPMSDDMENQQAVRLAKEADPNGERTIGVLTKPDTLPAGATGARLRWKKVIEGESQHHLRHGYYCVRLPDDEERARDISRTESQMLARQFFDTTPPWKDIPDRRRFGIPNFVSDISGLLVRLIENKQVFLPKFKENVDKILKECIDELSLLPPLPTTEPSTEILLRMTSFCEGFQSAVSAENHKAVTQANRRRYLQFKKDIWATRPDFRPFMDHNQYRDPETLTADSDEMQLGSQKVSPTLGLKDVRKAIANSIGWELPGHVPFEATKSLILTYTKLWRDPTRSCFQDVFDRTSRLVDDLLRTHFGQFRDLENYVRTLTRIELEGCKISALQRVETTLALESMPLFTQNTHYLESVDAKWMSHYTIQKKGAGRYLLNSPAFPIEERIHPEAVTSVHGNFGRNTYISGTPVNVIPSSSSPESREEYHDELTVMAKVRAYFQVAYKRVIDYIPLTIEHALNQELASSLRKNLFSSLLRDDNAQERMRELLQEDPVVANKRRFLEGRKTRLYEIKQKLDAFGRWNT